MLLLWQSPRNRTHHSYQIQGLQGGHNYTCEVRACSACLCVLSMFVYLCVYCVCSACVCVCVIFNLLCPQIAADEVDSVRKAFSIEVLHIQTGKALAAGTDCISDDRGLMILEELKQHSPVLIVYLLTCC